MSEWDDEQQEITARPGWDAPTEPRDRAWSKDQHAGAFDRIRHKKKRAFLSAYAMTGNIRQSCMAAEIHRDTYYNWQERDGAFAAAVEIARKMALERLEEEARRRAFYGTRKVKRQYFKDELVSETIEYSYSDTLMIVLLKALAPDKYADRSKVELKLDAAVQAQARKLAEEHGLDADELIAAAEDMLRKAAT